MQHLSEKLNPKSMGLKPFKVSFKRPESCLVSSMLEEGIAYKHPARTQTAIVWAESIDNVPEVLRYHYGTNWSDISYSQLSI